MQETRHHPDLPAELIVSTAMLGPDAGVAAQVDDKGVWEKVMAVNSSATSLQNALMQLRKCCNHPYLLQVTFSNIRCIPWTTLCSNRTSARHIMVCSTRIEAYVRAGGDALVAGTTRSQWRNRRRREAAASRGQASAAG